MLLPTFLQSLLMLLYISFQIHSFDESSVRGSYEGEAENLSTSKHSYLKLYIWDLNYIFTTQSTYLALENVSFRYAIHEHMNI